MFDQPVGGDVGHKFVGVADPPASTEPKGVGERLAQLVGGRWRECFGWFGHPGSLTGNIEQRKNKAQRVLDAFRVRPEADGH